MDTLLLISDVCENGEFFMNSFAIHIGISNDFDICARKEKKKTKQKSA